jgi:hypothetical protein
MKASSPKILDRGRREREIVASMRRLLAPALPFLASLFLAAPAEAAPTEGRDAPSVARASVAAELAVASGVTFALSPAVYSAARLVGTASADLNTSALPALLVALVVPPMIATGALAWERRREGAHARFFPPFFYALGAQALVLVGASLARTWVANGDELVLLSAVTGLASGGAATLGAELSF